MILSLIRALKVTYFHLPIHDLDQERKLLGKSVISSTEETFISDALSLFMEHYEHDDIFKDEDRSSCSLEKWLFSSNHAPYKEFNLTIDENILNDLASTLEDRNNVVRSF